MAKPRIAPYGAWRSPIGAELVAAAATRPGQVLLDGADVYWAEGRPAEAGRVVVMRWGPGRAAEALTPPPFNVRSRVHEYGGGAYAVHDGTLYFSNFDDNRLYRQAPAGTPTPITSDPALRYADVQVDPARGRLIAVREDHRDSDREAANTLVGVALHGPPLGDTVLAAGNDFYAAPRLSPDGTRLAWLTWNHPNMPWDGCELWLAELVPDGGVLRAERVAGGEGEAIFQPEWSPAGVLHFVSDRGGWWNLYRWSDGRAVALCPRAAEFGVPQWVFGQATYGFVSETRIACAYTERGTWTLALLDTETGHLEPLRTPFTEIGDVHAAPGFVAFSGGAPARPAGIHRLDLASGRIEQLSAPEGADIPPAYVSSPEPIEFPTGRGDTAHALLYRPRNPDFAAPPGARPPLIVISHGGPTSAASSTLNPGIQFWTSRGFGVVDVNYGGSSGYGRPYRERLNGRWGIVDVEDCLAAARALVERGEADGARLAIRGGSAGGYTTLAALTFHDRFAAGASHFGISDLEAMTRETHKFESRYLDRLVGPYPERADIYRERSPIHFTERLAAPLILFQGLDDKIVPPNQAEMMAGALARKGLPVAHVAFAGEGHGFRKAENIARALNAELYFYARVFGFPPPEGVEPVPITNLPADSQQLTPRGAPALDRPTGPL